MSDFKALTIRQPHAWAVARGIKTIENRPWSVTYRGPVFIHAGQQLSSALAFEEVTSLAREAGHEVPRLGGPGAPTEAAFGSVIAVADLVRSHRWVECQRHCDPWAHDSKAHLRLANPRILRYPVPANGNTILWTPSEDLVAEVKAAMPR